MNVPQRPRRVQECSFRAIGDEGGLVVLPGRSEVKVLNPAAILVFSLLDGEHTTDDIVAKVVEQFDVSEDVARADIEAFVGQLREHGMISDESAATEEVES